MIKTKKLTCKFCGGEVMVFYYSSIFGQPGYYQGMCKECDKMYEASANRGRAVKNVREGIEERTFTKWDFEKGRGVE